MPYIPMIDRAPVKQGSIVTAGELNYAITDLVGQFIERKGLNYENINTAIGVLEAAKLELYRRIAAPYEDTKIAMNGDVYPDAIKVKS